MVQNGITVLVVEDEGLVRMDIISFIDEEGFVVFEASNADEAIAILNANPRVGVMFTDIDMPGSMDGLKLAEAVRDRWPPIQIIVTSGHRLLADEQLPVQGRFFSKPHDHSRVKSSILEMASY
jgi:YesN/AraC family two-component response regulator